MVDEAAGAKQSGRRGPLSERLREEAERRRNVGGATEMEERQFKTSFLFDFIFNCFI